MRKPSPRRAVSPTPAVSRARKPQRSRVGMRARSFWPFPPAPLRTGRATFEASGSLVSLLPILWPIVMDVIMASFAERDALTFTGYHDFHPKRFLPTLSPVQVCQMAYVMHLDVLLAFTYFAGVV